MQNKSRGESHCPWCSAVCAASSSLTPPPKYQAPPPGRSQSSWWACWVCWPSTRQQRKQHWLPQTGRTSSTLCCRHWMTGASAENRVGSGPSCAQIQCSSPSPVCSPCAVTLVQKVTFGRLNVSRDLKRWSLTITQQHLITPLHLSREVIHNLSIRILSLSPGVWDQRHGNSCQVLWSTNQM